MIRKLRNTLRPLFGRLEAFGFACVRRMLYWRGRDITGELPFRRVLVIAPHQDDETLGAGVTVMRLVESGAAVHITVVTDGSNSHTSPKISKAQLAAMRRQEMIDACAALGVPRERVYFGPCEDRYVGDQLEQAHGFLKSLIEQVQPDLIISPSGIDRHYDHVAVSMTVARLEREGVIRCPVYEYPIWFFSIRTWTNPDRLTPGTVFNLFWKPGKAALTLKTVMVRTDGYLDRKRKALEAHRSQMFNLTGEPTWLTLPEDWLPNFFRRYEMFFPLTPSRAEQSAAPTEASRG